MILDVCIYFCRVITCTVIACNYIFHYYIIIYCHMQWRMSHACVFWYTDVPHNRGHHPCCCLLSSNTVMCWWIKWHCACWLLTCMLACLVGWLFVVATAVVVAVVLVLLLLLVLFLYIVLLLCIVIAVTVNSLSSNRRRYQPFLAITIHKGALVI